jgi:hypothetical protein
VSDATVIREFLVSLSFAFDKGSALAFDKKVLTTDKIVMKLGLAAAATAAAVTVAVEKISAKLEDLYFVSQRTGASAANISAFGYAVSQMGGSVEGARTSLENLARFVRNSPGALKLIESLGVRTHDENGGMRDMADILKDIGGALRKMPYYRANAYAGVFGIDEKTLMALRSGVEGFADDYQRIAQRLGLDNKQATASAHELMVQTRRLGTVWDVVWNKIASRLTDRLAKAARAVGDFFDEHGPQIGKGIERTIEIVLTLIDAITHAFGTAVDAVTGFINWVRQIDPAVDSVIKLVALLAAGWAALNIAIAASPVGQVLALGAAILLLYDDYKTFQAGGKSFIDWSKWTSEIDLVVSAFELWSSALADVWEWYDKLDKQFTNGWLSKVLGMINPLNRAWNLAKEWAGEKDKPDGQPFQPLRALADAAGMPKPGAAGAQGGAVRGNAAGAMAFFQGAGWSKEQAAGIVANIQKESGFNAGAVGDGGKAYGIAQWHPDRQANFEQWAGHGMQGSSFDEQMKFIHYELTQGAERNAGRLLRAATNADAAGRVVSSQYERPADTAGEATARGAAAVQIANTVTINAPNATPDTVRDIVTAQRNVNQELVRNMQGAVR